VANVLVRSPCTLVALTAHKLSTGDFRTDDSAGREQLPLQWNAIFQYDVTAACASQCQLNFCNLFESCVRTQTIVAGISRRFGCRGTTTAVLQSLGIRWRRPTTKRPLFTRQMTICQSRMNCEWLINVFQLFIGVTKLRLCVFEDRKNSALWLLWSRNTGGKCDKVMEQRNVWPYILVEPKVFDGRQ